jgi:choline kinase
MSHYFLPLMDKYVAQGLVNHFYEIVMAQLIDNGDLHFAVILTKNHKWAEIDTQEDLQKAERLFQPHLTSDDISV